MIWTPPLSRAADHDAVDADRADIDLHVIGARPPQLTCQRIPQGCGVGITLRLDAERLERRATASAALDDHLRRQVSSDTQFTS